MRTTKIRKLSRLFRLNEEPFEIAKGQLDILRLILSRKKQRVYISTTTQYGKSLVVSIGAILLASVLKKKVLIIAPKRDQSRIIMRYVLEHVLDSELFYSGLLDVDSIEKLKTERSKDRLAWSHGGEIMIASAESHRTSLAGMGLLGFGADVVILDESAGITDKAFEYVLRMLGRHADTKLIEISNPHSRNHFYKAFCDPEYHKIEIDYKQAIAEGRLTQKFIDEMRSKMTSRMFKIMYEVKFPEENEFTYFKPIKYETVPEANELKYFGACDPALGLSGKEGSLVGIVVIAKDTKGNIYEILNEGERYTPDQTMERIMQLPYRFDRFGVEAIQFQKYFLQEMQKRSISSGKYIPFVAIEQQRKKEERIESLEPFINTGQIKFSGKGELWDEMQNYPESDKLDVLDTLEMAWRLASGGGSNEISTGEAIGTTSGWD